MGRDCPAAPTHPTGQKLKPNRRTSPRYGSCAAARSTQVMLSALTSAPVASSRFMMTSPDWLPVMREVEQRGHAYLIKLRLTTGVKRTIERVMREQDGQDAGARLAD